MTRYPDFFLIGAPKCGTTSLAAWLAGHRTLFLCDPKEPNYYAADVASSFAATTPDSYLKLFAQAHQYQIVGEASTTYLRSNEAVPRILNDNPLARLIICLRNPLEMAPSVHAQLLKSGREPERDFARAWELQQKRRAQAEHKRAGHNPADLLYEDMCKLGAQVDQVLKHISAEQVLFILAEDMREDPGLIYRRVLQFLGVEDDGRTQFESHNERGIPRNTMLSRLAHVGAVQKARLGIRQPLGIGRLMSALNLRPPMLPEITLTPSLRSEMADCFRDDLALLARLVGRDLDHWLAKQTSVADSE